VNASTLIADRIKAAALEALQAADEIGGPDAPEYVAMMESLAAECAKRAETARENHGAPAVLRWVRQTINANADTWHTGGRCTAIGIPCDDGGHWLITDDCSAPESMDGEVCLGRYSKDGDYWICFNCDDMYHAEAIIRAECGASMGS
jgi:hypothetical protein